MLYLFILLSGLWGVLAIGAAALLLLTYLVRRRKIGEKQINRDLKQLRARLDRQSARLIPWSPEEMELLSLNLLEKKISRGTHPLEQGILKNIYQEPVLAYACKRYKGKDTKILLLVRGKDFELVMVRNSRGTTIYRDHRYIGSLQADGKLIHPGGGKVIGAIGQSDLLELPLYLDDQIVAGVRTEREKRAINPRALQLYRPLRRDEESLVLAMGMWQILQAARKD